MSEYYTHTLIAKQRDFIPTPVQISQFMSFMISKGVVPRPVSVSGLAPSGKTRTLPNPLGGEPIVHEIRTSIRIATLDDIVSSIGAMSEYEVGVQGNGRPELPPLPISFSDRYVVSARCQVSTILRSTSDPHYDFGETPKAVPYRKVCTIEQATGHFVNPHTGAEIEVPDAGSARFWIEFELGKFLFPPIENGNLQLLNPTIVTIAHDVFQQQFVQGCHWG